MTGGYYGLHLLHVHDIEVPEPVIPEDDGLWNIQESVCPVCRLNRAQLDEVGVFQPCRSCQQAGWGVRWKRPTRRRFRR